MYRHRALKFAIVISLHISMVALLLYVSLDVPNEDANLPSITVELLTSPQESEISPPAQTSKTQAAPSKQPKKTERPPPKHTEVTAPNLQRATASSTAPAATMPESVAASSPSPQKDDSPLTQGPAQAQAATQSTVNTSTIAADCPYRPSPTYPDTSNSKHEKGDVRLSINITAKGDIDSVDVKRSSGFPMLDETARNTVLRQWRCVPAHQNGKDIASKVGVLIQFVSK